VSWVPRESEAKKGTVSTTAMRARQEVNVATSATKEMNVAAKATREAAAA